ncbi:CDGSH iron-sulfur domain-containing protein 1-like isoform X1 [Amphibalanus amphitrite]|nr:CDGSH iron-sulfur domain-containing protein 1-like isoform X1 [Amphibalanus amphitrite]
MSPELPYPVRHTSYINMAGLMSFYSNLSGKDWAALVPFGLACGGIAVVLYNKLCPLAAGCVNLCHKKECEKVADSVDMEDLGDKAVFCRCWRSKKFPYCDGSHNKHNKETGDNVGPLIVKKKAA